MNKYKSIITPCRNLGKKWHNIIVTTNEYKHKIRGADVNIYNADHKVSKEEAEYIGDNIVFGLERFDRIKNLGNNPTADILHIDTYNKVKGA